MNELQWIGLIVKPIDYSLKGGILHIDAGAELKIEESQMIEIEIYGSDMECANSANGSIEAGKVEKIPIENGKIKLPDWASDVTTLVWFPVRAIDDTIARGESPGLYVTSDKFTMLCFNQLVDLSLPPCFSVSSETERCRWDENDCSQA